MDVDAYQKAALKTNHQGDDKFHELMRQILGLGDEAGEVQAIFKKWIRDDNADFSKLDTNNIKKELGDVLWYVAAVSDFFDIKLSDVATTNIEKLASRQKRGKLAGSGDNR